MTGGVCVCDGGVSRWARTVKRCPVCKGRHRGLKRLAFSGYGSDGVCGGCGTWYFDGAGRRPGKQEGERNRELVRNKWPRAATPREWRGIVRRTLEEALSDGTS